MPSIELISIGQPQPTIVEGLSFAMAASTDLQSDRLPSRFQTDFNSHQGVIYHLGNPALKNNVERRCFFAYELLSEESQSGAGLLEFDVKFHAELQTFFSLLQSCSPVQKLIFTTDWQFGPEWTRREPALSLSQFWSEHGHRKLLLNALYPIVGQ